MAAASAARSVGAATRRKLVPRLAAAGILLAGAACEAAGPAGANTAAARDEIAPLPRLHADPTATTVSGLSSGGFMAVQVATAFSASVRGVAVVAGGPYDCAVAEFGVLDRCMTGRPSGARAWQLAVDAALAGAIDAVVGVARQRVYLVPGPTPARRSCCVAARSRRR